MVAHSGLGAASPAPGSTVGGEITEIQLRYSSAVVDVVGSVTDPDGAILDSVVEQRSDLAVTILLADPLSTPGEYTVRHISTSIDDGDRVEAAYLFSFDPNAPPPILEIVEDDDGRAPWVWGLLAVGVAVIAVLALRIAGAVRSLRAARPTRK